VNYIVVFLQEFQCLLTNFL